jgi:hypothetical protein
LPRRNRLGPVGIVTNFLTFSETEYFGIFRKLWEYLGIFGKLLLGDIPGPSSCFGGDRD